MAETETPAGENETTSAGTETTSDGAELAPQAVAELLANGGAEVVDVRTDEEHAAGRIAGARHIPLERLQESAGELDRAKRVVFYCRTGDRSAAVAEAFRASGWEAASMSGGLVAWAEEGLPLDPEAGEVAPRSSLPGH